MKTRCLVLLAALLPLFACGDPGDGASGGPQFLSMGTAPVGGAFPVVGGAIAEVLNENRGENEWRVQPRGTKGSQENIRRLVRGELELAMSNSAISYFAVLGDSGWEQSYDIRAVVTLAPNIATFITKADSGLTKMSDLAGRRAMVGVAGAGFEMFVQPLLAAHGVTYDDFTQVYGTQSGAVDMLGDGSIDAAFLGGAVPTGAVTQACSTHDILFLPFDEEKRQQLARDYPFFQLATIPADAYSDLTEDYPGLNVGSMHLITSADADEELIYEITRTIWENRQAIADRHPAGRAINEANAARNTGTPFHPGSERYYREIGVWPEDAG
ncbi:MAG: TAXI family TRAP transporter solute-binding subunit [Acidobacteria bacterium]|nr:TAXI family TRAP transporter solute-binding subunit [Acidobacteriota bacterium]MCY3964449.1 TAXI family TRAP transporter solute-binding subunit [Acidobacteriota bacterium]